MNLVGHLVLPERVIGVVRAQPGDLPCLGQRGRVDGLLETAGAVDRGVGGAG